MQNMTGNVEALNETINKLTTIIRTAAKSVEEITGITDTINSISQQTNLLSLNASIEAARAGEMGRGCAIVGSEVGSLAQQSSQSTDHIRKLIKEVTKNIDEMNEMADTCLEDMSACVAGVETSNKSFDTIYEDVAKATDGIERITIGIDRINEVANGNAASTREQASRINEVLSLSEKIVSESNKIMSQTDSITQISESLNRYSDSINTDLSKYEL
jgi:methyl-accepting chemotaxis protein